MADHTEELAQLRAALEDVRQHVATLESELRGARQHIDLTMRGQLRCRACSCRRIAHAMKILDRGESDQRYPMALYKPSWWSSKTDGHLEAYVCTGCGLVEWWVADPGSLKPHQEYLRILDGEIAGDKAPYR